MTSLRDRYQNYVEYVSKIKTQGVGAAYKNPEEQNATIANDKIPS